MAGLSLSLSYCFSFAQCVGIAQLASACFSQEIVLCLDVDLMCPWEELSSGSLYFTILTWNPVALFLLND